LSPAEPVRIYYFAGTQHGSGTFPPTDTNPDSGLRGQQQFNWVDYRPLLRTALVNLDRWVTSGEAPPPSRHPRVDDATAATVERVAAAFPSIPGVSFPVHPSNISRLDFGTEEGIASQIPPTVGKPYANLVSAVDQDGNELGGILLPDLTMPIATHTGWNLRHADIGGTGQTLGTLGSTLPFSITRSQRDALGDPRPSLEERYSSREDYLGRVRNAAQDLVEGRYLLADEVKLVVDQAAQRYDLLHLQVPQAQAADGQAGELVGGQPRPELMELPQVFVTSHVSATGSNFVEAVRELFRENLRRFLKDEPLMNVVDRERGY